MVLLFLFVRFLKVAPAMLEDATVPVSARGVDFGCESHSEDAVVASDEQNVIPFDYSADSGAGKLSKVSKVSCLSLFSSLMLFDLGSRRLQHAPNTILTQFPFLKILTCTVFN